MDYDKLAKELGGSAYSQPDLDKLAADLGGELLKPSYGQQLISGEGPDIVKPGRSVLEGTTLTPDQLAEPATGPSLEEAIARSKELLPPKSNLVSDTGKLVAAGALPIVGTPEGIEAAAQSEAAKTSFLPMDIINQLANPQNIANKILSGDVFIPKKVQDNFAKRGLELPKPYETQGKDLIELNRAKANLDETLTKGKIPYFKDLSLWGEKTSKGLMEDLSPEMKDAIAMSTPTGDIVEALDTLDFSKISLGKDPSKLGYYGNFVKVFGSTAPVIASSLLTKSPTVGGVMGFGQASAEGVSDAREFIEKMSFKELNNKSEYFRNLIALGYDPDLAKQMTIDKAGNTAAEYQGIVGALGGKFTGDLVTGKLDKILPGIKSRLGRAIAAGPIGMGEEGFQEYMEGIATDVGIDKTVVREMGADSFANLLLGMLGGAGQSGIAAARELATPSEKPVEKQVPSTLTDVIVPTDIDPELHARASMKLEQLISQAEEVGKVNVREVNKLARELDIEPSKKVEDTTSAIYARLYPEAPAAEAAAEPTPPAKERPNAPTLKELWDEFNQKIEGLRPKKAPELTEEPVVETPPVATPEQAPIEQPEFKAPEPVVTPQVDELGQVETSPLEEARVQLDVLKNMAAQQGYVSDARLTDRINQMEAVVQELERREAAPQATEVVKEEAPKTQAQINQERQAAKREAAAAAKPSKEEVAEKKMLDAIEDIKKDKGTANQFIAKYGKPMFDRANAEGYIENQANDQRLFSTLKLDELWSKYNKPEEYAAMMKRRESSEKERQAEQARIAEEAKPVEKPRDMGTEAYPFAKPEVKVSENKVFTDDAAEKARALLKSKLNQLNSGIDPEVLQAGIILSGYHVEKGARTFAAYSAAMIKDLGNAVKPYLKSWYMALKYDPRSTEFKDEMDSADVVDKFEFEKTSEFPDLLTPEGKFEVAQRVSDALLSGAQYDNIAAARQFIKGIIGRTVNPGTAEAKEADEAIEVGVVMAARSIVDERNSPQETYDKLVDLYNRQPSLNVRTSESVSQQAYSTPAPLAYIASQFAGIDNKTTVYEPTAGNGMLLIGANPKNVTANELNPTRFEMLKRVEDGAELTNDNAMEVTGPKNVDAVIANPPFGSVGETFKINDAYSTKQIDHAISLEALDSLKDNGRAVLIVGSVMGTSEDARQDGYRGKDKRGFYYNLYKDYNVVDHFTVSGDLYGKQGAKFPVDVIVINGKGKSERSLPAADLPKVYSSYEQLKEKLDEASRMESRPSSIARVDSGDGATRASEREVLDTGVGKPSAETGKAGTESRGSAKESVSTTENIRRSEAEPSGTSVGRKEPRAENLPKLEQPKKEPVSSSGEGIGSRVGASDQRSEPTGLGKPSSSVNERVRPAVKEEETQYQITYRPKSKLNSVETLMPKGMADAISRALDRLEEKVGDIDAYVAKSLEMDLETLGDYFSAEQSDALALAINNAQKGKGFIIGDQTGIGKGRVVAGMIRYALANDKVPIFVTEKGNLYADMVRDLAAIGMADALNLFSNNQKILITNASSKDKIPYTFVVNENGKKVEKDYILQSPKKGQAMNKLLDSMAKDGNIGDFKVIFTTYDQMKTIKKGQTTPRREFLRTLADNNYIILDESHTAGGTGTPDPKKENVAKFARGLINNSYGSFFSSATYAKRANVMDLYASTDMSLAVENMEELGEAIQRGGVPMQQVVATMLAEAGQYIRREKSFEGITYETKEVPINKEIAESMATTLRNVLSFSSAKEAVVDEMQAIEDERGGIISGGDLIPSEVEGDNFGATMHNLIGQMLLGLKAEQAANYAVEKIKQGEKVVLTVSNTMGSFLNEFADDMGLSKGDVIDLTFKDLFLKYLNKQRIVKVKNEAGEAPEYIDGVKEVYLTDEMLGPKLTESFNRIKEQIENADYGTAPISPIDYMQAIIKKAGYKSSEITGRNLIIDYTAPALILDSRDSGITARLESIKQFNNADLNAMILNKAGSTGLSLHSSKDFINQSKRHMIIVQADPDIAIHMQMLGRVNRTGQVNKPSYTQLGGDIPAENRPMAVLAKKMASLNANTTAGQKSAVTAENVVDFVNEYGGQVAQEFLADNPWFNETIGNRIKVSQDATEGTEDDIRKLTGYIPVFPIKQQEEIYQDLLDRYTSLIDLVNSMGTNKLEAKAMDLDAKTLSSKQITEDKGDSPFAKPAYMEQIDVKRTVKPLSSKEVKEIVSKNLDGKNPAEVNRHLKTELREKVSEYAAKKKAEMLEKGTDPIRINQFEKQTDLTESHISTILNMYKIGDSVSLKDPQGLFTYGVITNISTSGKTTNPAAGSAWKINIALANGESKSLSINFSQIGTASGFTISVENIVDYLDFQTGEGRRMSIMDIFDAASGERREKRWMVTGNLLAGYAQYPGQIVFYQKNDGSVNQGILMSRLFDFEKAQKEAPVRIKSAGQAMRFFEEVGGVIGTEDNNFRIEKRGTRYEFTAAKSKRLGGKYFTNQDLMKSTGVFYSVSGSMKANTYSQQQAEEAISYLIDQMGEKLFVKTGIEKARAMFAPPKLENIEEKQLSEMAIADRKETIKEFAKSRRSKQRLVKQIAKYGSDIAMQRQLNEMLAHEENLKNYIDSTKIPNMSAEAFMAAATDALRDGNITPEVERFIRSVYEQYPNILNGIKLSVRAKEGNGRATGNFDPIERLVTLWKGTSGVRTSKTARHELVHTMEQMMTPEAKKAVITAWARNLETGMKKYKDRDSKKFFDAVLAFLENPTEETAKAATNIMPDYSYYQYLNPSEYWAVNAEKMFGQQLGGAWTRFVRAMEKLFEVLKAMFFMNNKLAVHRAFDQIIKRQPERNTRKALADYLDGAKVPTRFLNQIEEDSNLVDELDIPEVKDHTKQSFKEYAVESFRQLVASARAAKVDPKDTMQNMLADGLDKTLRQRNLHVWSAAGLADRDAKRWDGKIRTANGELIPSVAVSNNLRSAYIANAVMVRGGLEFNGKYGQFGAVEREHSVGNIIKIQAELRNRLTKSVADKLINGYTAARRSRGIQNDYFNLTKQVRDLQDRYIAETDPAKAQEIALELQDAQLDLKNNKIAYEKIPSYLCVINEKKPTKKVGDKIVPNIEFDQDGLPKLDDSKIDALIARDKAHPELKALMENFTAVNHNLLDNLAFSGRLSKPYVEKLKKRKDYSPWNRVMDEEGDDFFSDKKPKVNVSGVAHFKEGRTERDIDNVVESMIHNVYLMTRSAIKNYAQKRIIIEYGERRPSKIDPQTGKEVLGRLRVFPTTGSDEKGVRVPAYIGGRRMIFNIPDHLVADAYIGMSVAPWEYPFKKILTEAAQLSRRTITFSLAFQARQVFYDAWQAALVSGTQNPWRVVGKSLISFFKAVDIGKPNQTVQILGGFGIGGFRSHHREARKELEIEIGMMSGSNWQTLMSTIDNIGDASDLSQRVAVSEITMKETNDPALALYKASEVMDFGKHGLSTTSQVFRNTVTFMQAWATQLDTLAQSVIGGGVKGKARKELQKQFASTFAQFTILAIAYTLLALKDPDYDELDDLEKARNIYIPFSKKVVGHHVLLPLHNSASYFFKVIPELLVNSAKKYGTEKEIDLTRAGKVLLDSFTDSILGPTPIATGIKPSLEIFLDKDFYTGGSVVPKSVAKLDPEEQYVASTSELAKAIGRGLGISPAKADHFIRGTFGTAGALGQWFSNMIFSEHRVAPQLRETPGIGFLFGKDVNTLNEQLFYDLKERSDKKYDTWTRLIKDDRDADADKYYAKNQMLIEMNGYISSADEKLKYINTQIREIGRSEEKGVTSAEKRQEINDLNRQKQELLENIFLARKEAGL